MLITKGFSSAYKDMGIGVGPAGVVLEVAEAAGATAVASINGVPARMALTANELRDRDTCGLTSCLRIGSSVSPAVMMLTLFVIDDTEIARTAKRYAYRYLRNGTNVTSADAPSGAVSKPSLVRDGTLSVQCKQ